MERHKDSRYFIFDGIDGCGKSTQATMFADYLFHKDKHYHHILLTREPTYGAFGMKARQLLVSEKDPMAKSSEALEYFYKDRIDHIDNLVMPCLKMGTVIIQDRGKYSTIAYQGSQGIDISKIQEMHRNIMKPDAVVIFTLPVGIAMERMDRRQGTEMFETLEFQLKVKHFYDSMQDYFPEENIIYIDASQKIGDVQSSVRSALDSLLPF